MNKIKLTKGSPIKKLRLKLFILFTSLTSIVLLCMLIVTFDMLRKQYSYSQEKIIETEMTNIKDKILSDKSVYDSWLSFQEVITKSIIYIEDNQSPLFFKGTYITKTKRDKLIDTLKKYITEERYSSSYMVFEEQHTIVGDYNDIYTGIISQISINNNVYNILVIKDISGQTVYFRNKIFEYILIFIIGSSILGLLIWHLTKITLRSTEESIENQKIFVASASHELRSPITVMKTSLDAITADGSTISQFMPVIHNEIDRIARLVDDLTVLQTSDTNSWNIRLKSLEVDTVCMEMYEAFLPVAIKKQRQLSIEFANNSTPKIMGDKQRIQQIITILLNNAIEYTPPNSKIIIHVSNSKNKVKISIIDNGSGISDKQKKNIFKRFYRIDQSRTSKKHYGLGLSIAQELAILHKGYINIEDTIGGGSTFIICIPIT